jgi:hypothetical protein
MSVLLAVFNTQVCIDSAGFGAGLDGIGVGVRGDGVQGPSVDYVGVAC